MTGRATVFDAIAKDTTTEFHTLNGLHPSVAAGAILLEVVGDGSANFTLDIQGKVHENGTYANVDYVQIDQAGAAALTAAQLTVNDTTDRRYLIPIPHPLMQLVAGFTAGTITVHASYVHLSYTPTGAISALGAIAIEGPVAHDAVASGNPVPIGGIASADISTVSDVDVGDIAELALTLKGAIHWAGGGLVTDGAIDSWISTLDEGDIERSLGVTVIAVAPDAASDRLRTSMNAAPGIGALNVAPIGGDITLRASAVAGEASGTTTAVDDVGWIKSFLAYMNVSVVPTGGAPTLDVYIQVQLPTASGVWTDLIHFKQVATVTNEQVAWGPADANFSGLAAEGSAVTFDRFRTRQDAQIAASTYILMPLGDSLRVKWVFAAGGSTGDYTFEIGITGHS